MPIDLTCAKCGEQYRLKEAMAGKTVRCRSCQAAIVVPDQKQISDVEEFEVIDDSDDGFGFEVVARPGKGKRSNSSIRVKSGKRSRSKSQETDPVLKWVAGCLIAGAVCFLLMCAGIGLIARKAVRDVGAKFDEIVEEVKEAEEAQKAALARQAAVRADLTIPELGPASEPFSLDEYPLPVFPDLGPAVLTIGNGVTVHQVRLSGPQREQPGHAMTMNVYLPSGEAVGTRPLVLVAPAGTTLLTGNSVDGLDYHDETLPYAEAGAVTINFSLDGALDDESEDPASEGTAYMQFRDAGAGTLNAKFAIDYALAKIPSVNPQRIVIAGHSSAGTLALLTAAHESRLAAAIGYCPCSDLEERLGWAFLAYDGDPFFGDLETFVKKSSPMSHASAVKCPVFLFHASDDSNVPYKESVRFHELLKASGKDSTLSEPASFGDHYEPMIRDGIPRAITWMRQRKLLD